MPFETFLELLERRGFLVQRLPAANQLIRDYKMVVTTRSMHVLHIGLLELVCFLKAANRSFHRLQRVVRHISHLSLQIVLLLVSHV